MGELRVVEFPEREASNEILATLEELVALAKSGDLRSVAFAADCESSGTSTGWAWEKGADPVRILGGCRALEVRIARFLVQ